MTDEMRAETRTAPAAEPDAPGVEAPPEAAVEPKKQGSLSGPVLKGLALVALGWMLAVWQSPVLAPILPAPLAALITPQGGGGADQERRFAALEALAEDANAAADAALAAASGASDRLSELGAAVEDAVAGAAEAGGAAVEERIAALEAALDSLAEEVSSSGGPAPVVLNRLSALESAVREGGGAAELGDLPARLAALEETQAQYESFFDTAHEEAVSGKRTVIVATSLSSIDRSMTLGAPFSETLTELEEAVGGDAPEALAEAARRGAPTREALKASFPDAAHAAISAALVEEAGGDEDTLAGVLARIHARVTGLPSAATPGDSAPAVLSRARYALLNGDLDAAVAATEALPEKARAAMADWLDGARLRSAADHALAAWRAEIKTTL